MATYYSEDHEWITFENDETATLGITAHAASELGDIVYVEQREAGERFAAKEEIGVIESVKAASEIYAPVAMEIVAVNTALIDAPQDVNVDPEGSAWIYKIKITDNSELERLMNREAYDAMIA